MSHFDLSQILHQMAPSIDVEKCLKKLENYILVEDLDDLIEGTFIRYFQGEKLMPPCIICNLKFEDTGVQIFCKTIVEKGRKRFFYLNLDTHLIFRKLKSDEQILKLAKSIL